MRKSFRRGALLCAFAAITCVTARAQAYVVKETSSGAPVRWATSNVKITIDASLEDAVPGASPEVAAAAAAWNVPGSPVLQTSRGEGASPAVDGKNQIMFRVKYAPTGNAIAVTILTYDEKSGRIIDADIVFNGKYAFGVVDGKKKGKQAYDVAHVAAHELGHFLGLGDETSNSEALMFGKSKVDHASRRAPTADEQAGIQVLYGETKSETADAAAGCSARVANRPPQAFVGLTVALGMALALRGRRRAGAALVAGGLFLGSAPARAGDQAWVAAARTESEGGLFKTTLTLDDGREIAVWGGRMDGLVQRVGESDVPAVGTRIHLRSADRTLLAQELLTGEGK
jgi:hypothetical protein